MKKTLLLLCATLSAINFLSAQNAPLFGLKTNFNLKKMPSAPLNMVNDKTGNELIPAISDPTITTRSEGQTPGSIVIGTTVYDLETNGAVARRLLRRSDGTMTAVWTRGFTASSYPDRGTGYAYFDGTSWTCTNPTSRLENMRTGWPCIGILNGNEFMMCHNATLTGFLVQGTSGGVAQCSPADWNFVQSGASAPIAPGDTQSIWPRMAIEGTTIHVISNAQNAFGSSIAGVFNPTVYSISHDGGATWTPNIVLPLNDSTRRYRGAADQYDIDNNDSTTAIVEGGLGNDVALWKSTDNGESWQHTYIDSFPYAPNYGLDAPDSVIVPTNDGSVTTVVDNGGKIHVAFSFGQVIAIAQSPRYYPGTIGLKYWEEGMSAPVWVVNPDSLPSVFDANGDGVYSIGSFTQSIQNPPNDAGDQYSNQSWLSQPSITYDQFGDIFITFILPHDADTTNDGQTYRHIYMATHKAGDPWNLANWTIQDVNQNIIFVENAFACTARETTDSIRIEYMEDLNPGTVVTNGDPVATNNINYIAVSNPFWLVGIDNVKAINGIDVKQNFPNPFNKQSVIQIKMDKAAKLNFKVTDVLGKVVMQQTLNYSSGTHNITINRDQLSGGVYFYTVQAGNEQVTNKMIVE